jgi:hypothetical protein
MIKKLNTQIEKLFDQSNQAMGFEELKKKFLLSENNSEIDNLSYIFTKHVNKQDLQLLFTQLSSFFEVGFLFEKSGSPVYQAVQVFAFSKQMQNLDGLKLITLPQPEIFKILSTDSKSFLNFFKLSELDRENKFESFLIRLSERHSIVLMSSLAEPWLKIRLESLQKALLKIHFEQ